MRGQDDRYVVIEIEPAIGARDHIGFHQAGKYRTSWAMQYDVPVEEVRAMVVATTIDPHLRDHYFALYDIEWCEVPSPL